MPSPIRRPRRPDRRRGVTLVEMLVVVALVILMMVILVQIFQSATGAMTASRTSTELDLVLRQIDGTIRSDLNGVTAKMTPPNDPKDKAGYFEYGENAPADAQGEDTDDYMAFTTKAPEGQFFTGRQYLLGPSPQPTTITSQVAEVIYFLRNGNLYRRVFLVAPDRAKSITLGTIGATHNYSTSIFGGSVTVGWQGPNDISCRPSGFTASGIAIPIPNDLGDLTNRENRAFRPRFINDFQGGPSGPDGIIDDFNADGVPDYYPTLYYDGTGYNPSFPPSGTLGWAPNGAVHEGLQYAGLQRVEAKAGNANSYDVYAFPFIFPGMYSVADPTRASNLGALHYLHPNGQINHAPLSIGDNVPTPVLPAGKQTWWGFPTWRETMAGASSTGGIGWADPVNFVSQGGTHTQPLGLRQFAAPATNLLPPITSPGSRATPDFSDGAGSTSTFVAIPAAPNRVWEDDLILTNVRSFDIKAYDLNAGLYNTTTNGYFSAGYQDLGYGANPYIPDPANPGKLLSGSYIGGPNGTTYNATQPAVPWQGVNAEPIGFGHEGRIPPLPGDYRMHPRRPFVYNPSGVLIPNNIGDGGSAINRLNRVFDTWSTDYTNAPDTDLFLTNAGQYAPSLYPSFPPPYPSALRGIQIQIRIVDPRGERSKVLTIRHDFTDKLTN